MASRIGGSGRTAFDRLFTLARKEEPSLWVRLPAPVATSLVQRAERLGVQLLPGPTFSCADAYDDHLRIGFAANQDQLLAGLHAVAEAWRIVGNRV